MKMDTYQIEIVTKMIVIIGHVSSMIDTVEIYTVKLAVVTLYETRHPMLSHMLFRELQNQIAHELGPEGACSPLNRRRKVVLSILCLLAVAP